MLQLLKNLQKDMSQLQINPLLQSIEKIEIDQKLKLSEPNRRGLNLLLDLHNRQITSLLLLKACLFRKEVEEVIIGTIFQLKKQLGNAILGSNLITK